jgi:hypothetical protein
VCVKNSLGELVDRIWGSRLILWSNWPPDDWSSYMADLVFVILTVAFFALSALIVKGVERL